MPPYLARDTAGTIREARRLFRAVSRPNCHIKIPGTKEGIPAIEQMLYEGVNINITLLFSVERYIEVANAYIRAIRRRIQEGKPVDNVISVASVFISRIDTLADQLLSQYIIPNDTHAAQVATLTGKTGIATARLCYQRYTEIFNGEEWRQLEAKGARTQRLLWASTSNKNPLYDTLRYVDTLIGEDTINTLPDKTIVAFSKNGTLKKDTVKQGLDTATAQFGLLKQAGIDIAFITQQLENEGIRKFMDDYNNLIANLAVKRLQLTGNTNGIQQIHYGDQASEIAEALHATDVIQAGRLLFEKDAHLWRKDEAQTSAMSERLGWLDLPVDYAQHANDIIEFAKAVIKDGFSHAVLLGMGGSSLCSEVARTTYAQAEGYLQLHVLDNTDPGAIRAIDRSIDIEKTLFIVASKSGGTQETLSFFRYFYKQLEQKKSNPGDNCIAITDPGTPLTELAEKFKFRKVFTNPPDIGGRYAALSDFGLVPMALTGVDIQAVLQYAHQMRLRCWEVPAAVNPGIHLGVTMGICEKNGRNKVIFILSESINSFGLWAEQLIAESTGKEGRGLIPVHGESLADAGDYSNDRLFVYMYLASEKSEIQERKLRELEEAGHPVVRIPLENTLALGGEYYRWEVAVAIAGLIMGINPFDQPNVEESKKNTRDLLALWNKEGVMQASAPLLQIKDMSVYGSSITKKVLRPPFHSPDQLLNSFTSLVNTGDYIAILPYFMLTDERREILQAWREMLRDTLKVATTLLEGPRYLHSTGQLHKGGPDTGLFLLLVGESDDDLEIPGENYGFSTLHKAQAMGDFNALDHRARRALRIELPGEVDKALHTLLQSLSNAELHA